MLTKILGRLKPAAAPAPRAPDNLRLYVIGDVHGRLDLLESLQSLIDQDRRQNPAREAGAIFLGDYVDRGRDSAGVLDKLSRGDFPTPIIALRGNHEEVLLKFLEDENVLETWRKFGGLETLHSYGVPVAEAMRGAGYDRAREALLRALPPAHLAFLRQTASSVSFGDYFFSHAGVRPGVPLENQVADDLLWIREDFLRHDGPFGKIVVHGHTPVEKPDVRPHRINVDTGAYASSILTALVLDGESRSFLSTARAR
jgi:serine/threonine protein phosphatase 1